MRQIERWAAGALALGAAFLASGANADPGGIKVGTLTCHVNSGWGYVLGSSKRMECRYQGVGGPDQYVGRMTKVGMDIGYTRGATMVWAVVAPAGDVGRGALAGDYVGGTASATAGIGIGANGLVGGLRRSFTLQPLSFEGNTGYIDASAGLGVMHLAEVAPPPPPAPMPPPPPPMAAAPPPPTHFAVFFDFNRATLTDEAREVVKNAVNVAQQTGMVRIKITGHTDTVGSEGYNDRLSVRRAESVKAEMVADGLSPMQISVEGKGFRDPLVSTGPGVREPQNRRAVIDLGNATVSENFR
jgi:outer membrane protein OmpA-like peptidoglycan-associated protein